MKIKILHIIKSLGRGGAEMLLPETLKLHNKEEFEFHYIYFLPWKNQMVEEIENEGGIVSCFDAKNNIQLMWQLNAVRKYIRTHNIQLVHAHLPWAGFLARFIYKLMAIPVIYTEHNKQERYHKITYVLNKLTFNWQTEAIAVSDDVAYSIKENIKPKVSVNTILNGVNTESFQRILRPEAVEALAMQGYDFPVNRLVVGTVAVFRFQKRLEEWMEVFYEAKKENPPLLGVIVGDGPFKDRLIEKRKALGLENDIIMPGLQTNTKAWFSIMDIFMMTSEFEGLPIALLEAMSMKCAIVSTDAGGIKEVVRNDEDGFVIPVEEWRKLSSLLGKLKKDDLRLKLATNARERVMRSFSLKVMVNELELLYNRIVKL